MVAEGEAQMAQQLPKERGGGDDKRGAAGFARLDRGDAAAGKALLAKTAAPAAVWSAPPAPAAGASAPPVATTTKESGKRTKPEAPKFLLLLYEILEAEDSRVIRWSEDGSALQILSPETVTEKILPKYFNHTNFHSFQRQLNYFGFRKWTKSKTDICTFSHPCFRQNQPEMLQLIKRKKAPRRTPSPDQSSNGSSGGHERTGAKRTPQTSPTATGKRKLPSEERPSAASSGMVIQRPSSGPDVLIHPAANGIPIGSMTTPHASARQPFGFDQDSIAQYLPGAQPLLNNVISPLAASECKKKAKKVDRKDYPERENGATAVMPAPVSEKSEVKPTARDSIATSKLSPLNGLKSGTLPTLDIVRNRIIRRQQCSAPDLGALSNGHQEYAPSMGSSAMLSPLAPIRPDFLSTPFSSSTSLSASEQTAAPSPSFNDPVNILLHIKKSRGSEVQGNAMTGTDTAHPESNDSMASLQHFLLGHSMYTNRLEAQLKFVLEENDALKQLLDVRHREIQSLKNDRSMLQHENGSLSKDKTKLLEINRDLMGKLFPQ